MGFIFNEFENDKKQYVNLSNYAWLIIEQDMDNFYVDETKNKAGFLNTILANFYGEAKASINLRCIARKDYLRNIFDVGAFKSIDPKFKDLFIDKITDAYKQELILLSKSYPKGSGDNFRLNVDNVKQLRDESFEDDNYDGIIGLYLKAIYEEYSRKINYEREQIFFLNTINIINEAMNTGKKLKLSLKRKLYTKNSKTYNRKFFVTPYKIVQDTTNTFNYLIGYAEEIFENGEVGNKVISSFRISRIDNIAVMRSTTGFISIANKALIDAALVEKTPQFMAGDVVDIKVKFSKKGIESFQRQLYMKPSFYDIIDKENNIYMFHCTEVQAINYFFKFARDIEILEPLSLREKFIARYRDALNVYTKAEEEPKKVTE